MAARHEDCKDRGKDKEAGHGALRRMAIGGTYVTRRGFSLRKLKAGRPTRPRMRFTTIPGHPVMRHPASPSTTRLWAAALLLAAATAAAAADPGRGATVYQRVCSACHGEKGDGRSLASHALRTAPRDFTTEEARLALSREYMIAIVRDGRPHTPMVGRTERLAQDEIEAAVDFIRAAFMPPEPGTPLAKGRSLYRSSCAGCHGDRGQGGVPRGGGRPVPAVSAVRAGPGLTPERMAQALRRHEHVPGLPVPGLPLEAGESDAVARYIQAAFIEVVADRGGSR
ncbi:MAG: cytochrome c [Betaproteobacteria bacterium]|nr:cytochrome c [Betaproteobacteria bacterium]